MIKLRDHEKFWAFLILVMSIMLLALLATAIGGASKETLSDAQIAVLNSKLRIIDVSIAGLIGIAGMAAQALFRVSQTDKENAVAMTNLVAKMPEAPKPVQPVVVEQPLEKPIPVHDKEPEPVGEDATAGLPEGLRS